MFDDSPSEDLQQSIVFDVDPDDRRAAIEVAAWASVLALDEHTEAFPNRVARWLSGPFAKTARVAEKPSHLSGDDDAFYLVDHGMTVAVYPPLARAEFPRTVNRARLDRFHAAEPVVAPVPEASHAPFILLDSSLGMSTGKSCAQAAHAAMAMRLSGQLDEMPEVVEVSGGDFAQMLAQSPTVVIQDSGRTEIEPGSTTALGFAACWTASAAQ